MKEIENDKYNVTYQPLIDNKIEKIIFDYEIELRYLAFKYVRDWVLVDDIMQEVYLKIYLKLNSFKNLSTIKTWLYKVTSNQCIDHLRNKVIKSTILIENFEELLISNMVSAEKETFKKFEKGSLYRSINSLPIEYKQTLTLYYINQYSYKEISKLINKDISIVKNRLFRGRRMLKNKYFEDEKLQET